MPAVEWDPLAARVAQAHADRCMTMHNANRNADYTAAGGSGGLGENMYWGTGSHTVQGAVNLWASEVNQYNLAANTCSGVCGHYTQIVWANTVRIGCGAAVCNGTTLVVCDYNPPGNFIGQRPYTAAP